MATPIRPSYPAAPTRRPVPKVVISTLTSLVTSGAVAALNALAHGHALGSLPGWAQAVLIALVPPVITFLAGYVTPGSTPPVS